MKLSARLSDLTADRDNNFNLMRLGAAAAVVLSHSFILSYNEPNSFPRGLGYLAVNCFFIMSGFLICKSVLTRRDIRGFYKARILRIYPALTIAILACVLIVGPLHTDLPLAGYFSNSETYHFLIKNSLLLFNVEPHLPAVFGSHGSEKMVNAPIWTLVFEIYLYLFIGLLGLITLKKGDQKTTLFIALLMVLSVVALAFYVYSITLHDFTNKLLADSVRFAGLFGIGASYYVCRKWIRLSPLILISLLATLVISIKFPTLHKAILYPILAYLLFYMAYIPRGFLLSFNRLGDYSYGVYIFAYPIQQSISHWNVGISTMELFISSFLLSLFFAVLSWHYVESKALSYS